MPSHSKPVLALSTGDPAGIGPSVCLRLLQDELPADVVCVGDRAALAAHARLLDLEFELPDYQPGTGQAASVMHVPLAEPVRIGTPSTANATSILAMLVVAAGLADQGLADGLVTAPVAKSILAAADPGFSGHTEFLAQRADCPLPVMAMVGARLRVAFATTHLPLAAVPAAISADLVEQVLRVADQGMRELMHPATPRWLVCGLNPHAGEGGLLGTEEAEAIAPGIAAAKSAGVDAVGPLPADTVFVPQRLGPSDCVLAMYHDQALPVVKRDDFAGTVNTTFGLPYVRTSVDHGTAFDIAAAGTADAGSLRCAVELACAVVARRRASA